MQTVDFLSLFLMMWLAGICFSKSRLRAVDVAGTMALARAPMLLLVIVCFLPIILENHYDIFRLMVFGLICIPFTVWMIALMYNAYAVSCHLKGGRAAWSFIGALLVAEVISKLVFIFLLSSLFTNVPIKNIFNSESSDPKEIVVAIDSLTIRQKTENVVKAFERGNFDAITVYFDETMKKKLSPNLLKMAWIQNNFTCGKFEKANMDSLKETSINKYNVIEVPFFFAKEKRNLRLTFNSDGEISGLFLLPVN
jgi:hypothetical protein